MQQAYDLQTWYTAVADPEGVRGVRLPIEPKLFHFRGEYQEKLVKLHKSNPPQLMRTPDPKILDPPLYSIRDLDPIKFVQMMILSWPWTTLQQDQLCSLQLLYGKMVKYWVYRNYLSLWTESWYK